MLSVIFLGAWLFLLREMARNILGNLEKETQYSSIKIQITYIFVEKMLRSWGKDGKLSIFPLFLRTFLSPNDFAIISVKFPNPFRW